MGHIGFHHRAPFVLSARAPSEFGASFWLRRPMYPRVLTVPPHWKPEAIAQGLKRGELLEFLVTEAPSVRGAVTLARGLAHTRAGFRGEACETAECPGGCAPRTGLACGRARALRYAGGQDARGHRDFDDNY